MPIADFLSNLIHATGYNKVDPVPDYNVAYSRLTRNPVIISKNPAQFNQLTAPDNDYGVSLGNDLSLTNNSPLASVVRNMSNRTGKQTTVLPQWEPNGMPGALPPNSGENSQQYLNSVAAGKNPVSDSAIPMHESTHQLLNGYKVNLDELYQGLDPQLRQKIKQKLGNNYTVNNFSDEIPARLGAGQFASLGLERDEASKLWGRFIELYSKDHADAAKKLKKAAKGNYDE